MLRGYASSLTWVLRHPRTMLVVTLGTVSYTHLRAHETVLDLVCRLLLEKKKHHSSNTSLSDMLSTI